MFAYKIKEGKIIPPVMEFDESKIDQYVMQGYIFDKTNYDINRTIYSDNKFIDVPPTVIEKKEEIVIQLTPEQIKQQNLQMLDYEYQPQFIEITRAWSNAIMDNDQTLANKLQISKTILKNEYNTKREEIING